MVMMMGGTKEVMKVVMMVWVATEEAVVVSVVVVVATEMVATAMVMASLQARASVGAKRSERTRQRVGCRIGHSAVLIACPVVCGAVSVASSSASCCVYCVGMGSVGREGRAQDHHRRGRRGLGGGTKMMLARQMPAMTVAQAEAVVAMAMMSLLEQRGSERARARVHLVLPMPYGHAPMQLGVVHMRVSASRACRSMVQRLQSEPLPLVCFVGIGCLWSAVLWFRDGGPVLQQHCWLMGRRHWLGLIRMDRHRARTSIPRRMDSHQ